LGRGKIADVYGASTAALEGLAALRDSGDERENK
jgi:hypothetical protein